MVKRKNILLHGAWAKVSTPNKHNNASNCWLIKGIFTSMNATEKNFCSRLVRHFYHHQEVARRTKIQMQVTEPDEELSTEAVLACSNHLTKIQVR